jgi:hypothetical protein
MMDKKPSLSLNNNNNNYYYYYYIGGDKRDLDNKKKFQGHMPKLTHLLEDNTIQPT